MYPGVRRRLGRRVEAWPGPAPLRGRFVLQGAVQPREEARKRLHGVGRRIAVPGKVSRMIVYHAAT